MRIIRLILGRLILFFDWLFTPRGIPQAIAKEGAVAT